MGLKLFAGCIPVKGAGRSVICDLHRRRFDYIPNALYELLKGSDVYDPDFIKKQIPSHQWAIIDEYTDFLRSREYIFFTDNPESFPNLSLKWEVPNLIVNSIVEYNTNFKDAYFKAFHELSLLGCKFIEIWFGDTPDQDILEALSKFENSTILGISLYINTKRSFDTESDILKEYRVGEIIYYNCEEKTVYQGHTNATITCSNQPFPGARGCGTISENFFTVNIQLFSEAQEHNTCLNKKICIDYNGRIKNCPSYSSDYGSILDTSLIEVITKTTFTEKWFLKKDDISGCKDCEFRYICTDCRAYIEDPSNIYSKPLKCGYNPYTCQWDDWSASPLKRNALDYYGLSEL